MSAGDDAAAVAARLSEVLAALAERGLPVAEIYVKRGRSRQLSVSAEGGELVTVAEEAGWSVRAGDDRCSLAVAASGAPRPDFPWPEPDGQRLDLPPAVAVAAWRPPPELDAPLVSEREGLALLTALRRELAEELPGAMLLTARLTDGASESQLLASSGAVAVWRSRAALLEIEARVPGGPRSAPAMTGLEVAAREARQLRPQALARRLADALTVAAEGSSPERERGDFLLAPPVAARLLAGLLPLLVGPEAVNRRRPFEDRRGRIGGEALTVIDDGRLAAGLRAAPVDGEGVPTRERTLIEAGKPRRPLTAWGQLSGEERRAGTQPDGCALRAGWRELPVPGPTHLYLAPRREVAVGGLLTAIARGFYLIDAPGPARFDWEGDRFTLPVSGFAVDGGSARGPIAGAALTGGIGALLSGIRAAARDLTFQPLPEGLIGSPTLLVKGIELVGTGRPTQATAGTRERAGGDRSANDGDPPGGDPPGGDPPGRDPPGGDPPGGDPPGGDPPGGEPPTGEG